MKSGSSGSGSLDSTVGWAGPGPTQGDRILARYDFVVSFSKEFQAEFRQMYDEVLESDIELLRLALTAEFRVFVRETLGEDVFVEITKLETGSLVGVITLLLAPAMTLYVFLSQYHDFIESLNLIKAQLRSLINKVLSRQNHLWGADVVVVLSRTYHSPQRSGAWPRAESSPIYSEAFFWYLLLMNITLMGILGLLCWRAIQTVYLSH
jgi:hypothetical protein